MLSCVAKRGGDAAQLQRAPVCVRGLRRARARPSACFGTEADANATTRPRVIEDHTDVARKGPRHRGPPGATFAPIAASLHLSRPPFASIFRKRPRSLPLRALERHCA